MEDRIAVLTHPIVTSVDRQPCLVDTGVSLDNISGLQLTRRVVEQQGEGIKSRGYALLSVMPGTSLDALYRGLTGFSPLAPEDTKEVKSLCLSSDELNTLDWARVIIVPVWDYIQSDIDAAMNGRARRHATSEYVKYRTVDSVVKKLITKLPALPTFVSMQRKYASPLECAHRAHESLMDAVRMNIDKILSSPRVMQTIDQELQPAYRALHFKSIPTWIRWPRIDVTIVNLQDDGYIQGYNNLYKPEGASYFPYLLDQIVPEDVARGKDDVNKWCREFTETIDISKEVLIEVGNSVDYQYTENRNPHQIAGTVLYGGMVKHSDYKSIDKAGQSFQLLNRSYHVFSICNEEHVFTKIAEQRAMLDTNDNLLSRKYKDLEADLQMKKSALQTRMQAITSEENHLFAQYKKDLTEWRQYSFDLWEKTEVERKAARRRSYETLKVEQIPDFVEPPAPAMPAAMVEILKQNREYMDQYSEQAQIEFNRSINYTCEVTSDMHLTPQIDISLGARQYPRFGSTQYVKLNK